MKNPLRAYSLFFLLAGLLWSSCSSAQKTAKPTAQEVTLRNRLLAGRFKFVPESITPQGKQSMDLIGGGYWFFVKSDSITANLPYYGVAYSASATVDDPLDFRRGIPFKLTSSTGKNGRTLLKYKLPVGGDAREITLDVSPDGFTSMYVSFNYRQSIELTGRVSAVD